MKKAEFIKEVAERSGVSKSQADAVVKAFTEVVTERLSKGDKIQLVGFGTFETQIRSEREGRNPATGAVVTYPAKTVPKFKAGSVLKKAVNNE
jgi:DNA-binding protein HU-beta